MVSISTWNVNSVKARLPHLLNYLKHTAPDVVLLQEIKCVDDAFPRLEVEELGYHVATCGQKTYNGVAILSRLPLSDINTRLPVVAPEDEADQEARYIEARVGPSMRVASVYVPMGQEVGSPAYASKLRFLARLLARARRWQDDDAALVIGGDFNIAPDADSVWDAQGLEGHVLYNPELRAAYRRLLHLGLVDALRALDPTGRSFTWWDYRGGAFPRGLGMRIDHVLLAPAAADRLEACVVDEAERARDKASDHAPVRVILAD